MRLDSGLAALHEKPFEPFMSEGFDHEGHCSLYNDRLQRRFRVRWPFRQHARLEALRWGPEQGDGQLKRTNAWDGDFRRVRFDKAPRKLPTAGVPHSPNHASTEINGSVISIAAAFAQSIERTGNRVRLVSTVCDSVVAVR